MDLAQTKRRYLSIIISLSSLILLVLTLLDYVVVSLPRFFGGFSPINVLYDLFVLVIVEPLKHIPLFESSLGDYRLSVGGFRFYPHESVLVVAVLATQGFILAAGILMHFENWRKMAFIIYVSGLTASVALMIFSVVTTSPLEQQALSPLLAILKTVVYLLLLPVVVRHSFSTALPS